MSCLCSEDDDDDAADTDMNSSRTYSDDEDEGALSKKDVSYTESFSLDCERDLYKNKMKETSAVLIGGYSHQAGLALLYLKSKRRIKCFINSEVS